MIYVNMSSWLQGLDAVGLPTFAAELCICFTPFKGRRAGLWTVHCASTNGRCSHHSTMRKNLRKASIQWQKLKRIRLTIYIYILLTEPEKSPEKCQNLPCRQEWLSEAFFFQLISERLDQLRPHGWPMLTERTNSKQPAVNSSSRVAGHTLSKPQRTTD